MNRHPRVTRWLARPGLPVLTAAGTAVTVAPTAPADTNYRGPSGVLRDPSTIRHNGLYRIARTVRSWTTNSTRFNIASSPDLVNWTHVTGVASGIADTRHTWAPEFHVEGGTVRVIASTAQMGGLGHDHIDTADGADIQRRTCGSGDNQRWSRTQV